MGTDVYALYVLCKTGEGIAKELVEERKKAFTNEKKDIEKDSDNLNGNDLLSVLIKANMDPDIPESQRMNDEDVLSRKSCSNFQKAPNLSGHQKSQPSS